jgi:hypothetical protein
LSEFEVCDAPDSVEEEACEDDGDIFTNLFREELEAEFLTDDLLPFAGDLRRL